MDIQEIKKILALFEKSAISEMEVEIDGSRIRLKRETAPVILSAPSVAASPVSVSSGPAALSSLPPTEPVQTLVDEKQWVKAPLVGTAYLAPSPTAPAYVSVGQTVDEGQVVCVIEAMKVMNEIKAHKAGTVKSITIDNGTMVEFNQHLVQIGD
jgi:acetyl-CoA carboxylase biotin carboxyl carrier protein